MYIQLLVLCKLFCGVFYFWENVYDWNTTSFLLDNFFSRLFFLSIDIFAWLIPKIVWTKRELHVIFDVLSRSLIKFKINFHMWIDINIIFPCTWMCVLRTKVYFICLQHSGRWWNAEGRFFSLDFYYFISSKVYNNISSKYHLLAYSISQQRNALGKMWTMNVLKKNCLRCRKNMCHVPFRIMQCLCDMSLFFVIKITCCVHK